MTTELKAAAAYVADFAGVVSYECGGFVSACALNIVVRA